MRNIDLSNIFDSMKKNEISEVIIKEGKIQYEIRRGGFKAVQQTAATSVQSVPVVQATGAVQHVSSVSEQSNTAGNVNEAAKSNYHEVKAPLVGTYYATSKPDTPAFVEVGTKVTKGQTLCLVEAMKNFNEIESDVNGVVKEICCKTGDLVEFGKVLFRIEAQ